MVVPNFINKIVIPQNSAKTNSYNIPIYKRISTDIWNTFSNLNFAGVFRLGSELNKDECFIGSGYNLTIKITQHLNMLLRNDHFSSSLQEWFNNNGIDLLDISVLAYSEAKPDLFKEKELEFIRRYKPKFNTIINTRTKEEQEILEERKYWKPTTVIYDFDKDDYIRVRGDIPPKKKLVVPVRTVVRNIKFV